MSQIAFPERDYVSPGLERVRPDTSFPHMIVADASTCTWPYVRRTGQHNWYRDERVAQVRFANRDEVHVLYNSARMFRGLDALEISSALGWSACHLALGGVRLDVIDPLWHVRGYRDSVTSSLQSAGVLDAVTVYAARSPDAVTQLAQLESKRWSLIFIDGNHEFPGPVSDAVVCERYAADDAMILFHDLLSPHVAEGLQFLRARGWKTRIYFTSQVMGVAWRGNVRPVHHIPDPTANWEIPEHLRDWPDAAD